MSKSAISAAFSGQTAEFDREVATKTIEWKQGSFVGIGGDRTQTYKECHYKINGKIIVVFVQQDMGTPKPLTLNNKLQYGLNKGDISFVLHNKEQKPYQHRFVMNPLQTGLSYANEVVKNLAHYDPSWIMGDYLHDL